MSTKLQENYKKIKLLGEGSFGKAQLVECDSDKTFAVIKQMDIAKMTEEERKDTLMEAKILEKLRHPNIIRFREVQKTKKGKLCIVMDQADGGDLSQRISARKGKEHFKEHQIMDQFVQICLAMKHIHDRKVLHRDLKSQNIFLTKGNMVKLGDFGIAKMLNTTNQMVKTMVGTPYQLSPEIVEGKKYSFKSDIWSMGILLQEMCTLKPPFDANSLQYLALKIVNGKYTPIPTHQSKDLKNLVTLMLSRDPAKRPRVHDILQLPIVKERIKEFLTKTQLGVEFNHTVIHKKDLNQIHLEEQQKVLVIDDISQGNDQNQNQNIKKTKSKQEDEQEESKLLIAEAEKVKRLEDERKAEILRKETEKIELAELQRKELLKKKEEQRTNSSRGRADPTGQGSLSNRQNSARGKIESSKSSGGGSSQRGAKPKNPINVNVALEKKEKLRNVDEKIQLLQKEREEAKKINEERKKKRDEERKNFINEMKNKSFKKEQQNEIEVYWSEKNALNKVEDELKSSPSTETTLQPSQTVENFVVSKENEPSQEEDESLNPCGINELAVDSDDMKAMNEAMMNVQLDEEEGKEQEEEGEEQLDQDMMAKLSLSTNQTNQEEKEVQKFSGDIQQFLMQLEERLGSKTLNKVKELIRRYNSNEDPEQEQIFKEEIEGLMDEQSRLSYMPLIHALINMEEMIKQRRSRI